MKNNSFKALTIVIAASVGIAGCNGLGKMVKNNSKVTYKITPSPLEMHGDSVAVTISGKYPEKYFAKKAVLTVTPTIKYAGGEKALKPVTLMGEKAVGSGTKIAYKTGGSFTYTDKVAYQSEMKVAEMTIKAMGQVKKKTKEFPATKIADGTIITPLLVKNDEKAILGVDKFVKIIPVSAKASIYYPINSSAVRPAELKNDEMKSLREFIEKGVGKKYEFKGMDVSAYASPDGALDVNQNLAEGRSKTGSGTIKGILKDKKTKVEAAAADEFYKTNTTAEDWDGFKQLMEASSLPDKDLVLRVLSMYSDPEQREKEIKNMAKTYTEIADQVLPKLRRTVLTLNAEEHARTDEQITNLVNTHPDSLSIEEILYAATLTQDLNQKLNIYNIAAKQYPGEWRGFNNAAYIQIMQNKGSEAAANLEKANSISANNPIVLNSMGIVAAWKGDRKGALDYYKQASSAGTEPSYNSGIIHIKNGNYTDALTSFGSYKTFNVALATLLNGTPDGAPNIIDAAIDEKDAALSFYLKAISGARTGKEDLLINNLKIAITKDASFKNMAKDDCEFLKFRDKEEFKALIN